MPASYFVDFTAYVNERIRPEGFPKEVHIQETYENVENTSHLQMIVNDRFVKLVTSAGLVVLKDPTGIMDSSIITFDRRRFIPWHMLTHMELKVSLIPETNLQPQDSILPPELVQETKKKVVVN
jgi:hypothetical protein